MAIPVSDLAYTGIDMKRIVEPGTFTVFVGSNAAAELSGRCEVVTQ
jgi:beta-glucosidase